MDKNIETFLKNLLQDSGQTDLPPEVERQLLRDLNVRLEQRLVLSAMNALSEEKQLELEKMVERNASDEEKSGFIKENLPDADKVFTRAFEEFRDLYIEK